MMYSVFIHYNQSHTFVSCNNDVDCSGLYHDVNRILNTFINNAVHTNITKAEHLVLENLWKDKDNIIVTADKDAALVVMDKNRIHHKM